MIVVDANVALDIALMPGPVRSLFDQEPVGPPLMWSEGVSALRRAVWRGDVVAEVADAALERFLGAPIQRRSPRRLHYEAWQVARELGWGKTYDAEYVALARLLDCRLVTRDARLLRGAAKAVEVVGPTDL